MSYIDLYCERLAPGLLGEPLNALTNLAFFLAAGWVWRRAARAGAWRNRGRLLAVLLALIGAGSLTFHTFATVLAEALDEWPILIFQMTFLAIYGYGVLGWKPMAIIAGEVAFIASIYAARQFPALVNGSLPYLPALLVLLAIGGYHRLTGRAGARAFLAAAGLFLVSAFFRSIDLAVCPVFPLGTHFLWHLCNAGVLALSAEALMAGEQRRHG